MTEKSQLDRAVDAVLDAIETASNSPTRAVTRTSIQQALETVLAPQKTAVACVLSAGSMGICGDHWLKCASSDSVSQETDGYGYLPVSPGNNLLGPKD